MIELHFLILNRVDYSFLVKEQVNVLTVQGYPDGFINIRTSRWIYDDAQGAIAYFHTYDIAIPQWLENIYRARGAMVLVLLAGDTQLIWPDSKLIAGFASIQALSYPWGHRQ